MKVKVFEATDAVLDWMVAYAKLGRSHAFSASDIRVWASVNTPSKNWASGGPIIEREGLRWNKIGDQHYVWTPDHDWYDPLHEPMLDDEGIKWRGFDYGPTLLIAAMRCYVAFKLGYEVDVPEELFK